MSQGRHSYVPFYASDWIAGTARMTPMQEIVYFRICCWIWDKAKPCPPSELPLLLGAVDGWKEIIEDLVAAGKLERIDDGSADGTPAGTPAGSLANRRALEVACSSYELWEKKSRGGKTGAIITNNLAGRAGKSPDGSGAGSADGSPARSPDGSGAGVPSHNHNHLKPPYPLTGDQAPKRPPEVLQPLIKSWNKTTKRVWTDYEPEMGGVEISHALAASLGEMAQAGMTPVVLEHVWGIEARRQKDMGRSTAPTSLLPSLTKKLRKGAEDWVVAKATLPDGKWPQDATYPPPPPALWQRYEIPRHLVEMAKGAKGAAQC